MPQRALMKFVLRVESRWLASGDTLRCGFLILADDAWCPDRTDNRAGYLGPSHVRCNRGHRKGDGEQRVSRVR
jgi:hypothetical protein